MDITPSPTQLIRIYALGRLEIVIGCVRLHFNGASAGRPIELLKGLLTLGGRPVGQHALCEALWPDSEGDAAYRALITTVYRLRRVLRCPAAVTFADGAVGLDPHQCWVDAWAFEHVVMGAVDPAIQANALQLYAGPLLGDTESPLAFEARDRLRRKHLRAVLQLGKHHEQSGNLAAAIDRYEATLEADITSEDLFRQLISCHMRLGQHSAALDTYRRCREMLRRHFGTRPATATERALGDARPVSTESPNASFASAWPAAAL